MTTAGEYCMTADSLTFSRKTPWARKRVEQIFIAELP